jgi:hypothetical protein
MEKILEKYKEVYLDNNDYDDYDDDSFEESIPEELQAIDLLNDINITSIEDFKIDASGLAKHYINLFFLNKDSHNSLVEKSSLLTQEKILVVINTSIISGIEKAYSVLDDYITITQEDINKAKKEGDVTPEIKLVNETLKSLYEAGVPQQFAGGMMLLYLEYCKGVNFGT